MKKNGFTIIELVTVISIIALLIGIMAPGLSAIVRQARELKQKGQFKLLTEGIQAWSNNNNMDYPESILSNPVTDKKGTTFGSHKLCEALVGRDLKGFDINSSWNASKDESKNTIYSVKDVPEEGNRVDRYIDLDRIDTFQLGQLYPGFGWATGGSNLLPYPGNVNEAGVSIGESYKACYVFTDVFKRSNVRLNGKIIRAGSPVLYYKADNRRRVWNPDTTQSQTYFQYFDNAGVIEMGKVGDSSIQHPYDFDWKETGNDGSLPDSFYERLINPKSPSSPYGREPYNKDSYLLLSAGHDGLFGTKDDIWNISE